MADTYVVRWRRRGSWISVAYGVPGLCFLLKGALRGLDPLRKSGALHWIALALTVLIGVGITAYLLVGLNPELTSEVGTVCIAMTCMVGVLVWGSCIAVQTGSLASLKLCFLKGSGGPCSPFWGPSR